ncbi:MAG: aldo/keto reductase [Deltaproteobacteria bacterium]|nr:aldo/keto reductase [Deltaproteobacteria bacterium]
MAERMVKLPNGVEVPVLGQGTWQMAEHAERRADEIAALRAGLDLGLTLIDTAEMYADGAAETLVGEAIAGRRDDVFLVSKVLPENATARGTIAACERSLRRLGTEHLDLYLLHWRGSVPLVETLAAFVTLTIAGKIRSWGVSNFDVDDLAELGRISGASSVQTNQVLYNLTHRGIEWDLLPQARARRLPIMAYSPIDQGRLLGHPGLARIADRHDATPAQIALAWVLQQDNVFAVAKAGTVAHVRENHDALAIRLTAADRAELDAAFSPPTERTPLETL